MTIWNKYSHSGSHTTVTLTLNRYVPKPGGQSLLGNFLEEHNMRRVCCMEFTNLELSAEDIEHTLSELRTFLTDPHNNKPA